MNRLQIVHLIAKELNIGQPAATKMLDDATYPNFYCERSDISHNAVLTFITGDSYKVTAKMTR